MHDQRSPIHLAPDEHLVGFVEGHPLVVTGEQRAAEMRAAMLPPVRDQDNHLVTGRADFMQAEEATAPAPEPAPAETHDWGDTITFMHAQMETAMRMIPKAQRAMRDREAEYWLGYRRGLTRAKNWIFDGDSRTWRRRLKRQVKEQIDNIDLDMAEPDRKGYVAAMEEVRKYLAESRPKSPQ